MPTKHKLESESDKMNFRKRLTGLLALAMLAVPVYATTEEQNETIPQVLPTDVQTTTPSAIQIEKQDPTVDLRVLAENEIELVVTNNNDTEMYINQVSFRSTSDWVEGDLALNSKTYQFRVLSKVPSVLHGYQTVTIRCKIDLSETTEGLNNFSIGSVMFDFDI